MKTVDELTEEELNALIATQVMGLPEHSLKDAPCPYCGDEMRLGLDRAWCSTCREWRYSPYKDYTGEMGSTWEVVNKKKDDYTFMLAYDQHTGKWWACFDPSAHYEARAETPELAICRAAYLTVKQKSAA